MMQIVGWSIERTLVAAVRDARYAPADERSQIKHCNVSPQEEGRPANAEDAAQKAFDCRGSLDTKKEQNKKLAWRGVNSRKSDGSDVRMMLLVKPIHGFKKQVREPRIERESRTKPCECKNL